MFRMQVHEDGSLRITKFGPLGPFANNAYIISDDYSREAIVIDMPGGSAVVTAELRAHELRPKAIVLTHTHPDHWADYDLMKRETQAPVLCHPEEHIMPPEKADAPLTDGQEISVGPYLVHALHTPGHTPGSTCFLVGRYLFSGDTLFPGGPGRTNTPQALQQTIRSITERLFQLPADTQVLPGHGDDTTIADAKLEYAAFAARQHPPDLCGDVIWAGS